MGQMSWTKCLGQRYHACFSFFRDPLPYLLTTPNVDIKEICSYFNQIIRCSGPNSRLSDLYPLDAGIKGRRFHNATRMPTASSGLGSSSRPAWVQQVQVQWPGLCPDGWDSPHPSCSCSSTTSYARPSANKGWTRQGSHQSPKKDRASFCPAMLPDFPTTEALNHRASWKITAKFLGWRDRQTKAWGLRG